jgi:import receptor subunit TOM70
MSESVSFFKKHQVAIAATVGVAASAAIAYYALSQTAATPAQEKTSKKKKHKKTKKAAKKAYPTDEAGNPVVTKEYFDSLSDEQKDAVALALKEDGNELFKNKQFEEAAKFYTAALEVKQDPAFYSNRSACYIALKDFAKVIEDTTAALKIKPDYTKCILRRATAYEQLGDYREAMFDLTAATVYGGFNTKPTEESLERILKTFSYQLVAEKLKDRVPQLPSAASIASFFSGYQEESTVEGLPSSAAELEPNTGDFFLVSAIENINERSYTGYEKADSFIQQAISAYEKEEQTESVKHKLAVSLEYAGILDFLKSDPLKALEEVERAIELHPRSRSYVFKAMISADKQDVTEAEKCLEAAIALDPSSSEIYYQRGQMYYLFGDLEKAELNFTKSKELNPKNLYAHIQLACIIYRKGDFTGADKAFQEARKVFPTSPEIPNYYGEILADRGDFERAATQFDVSYKLEEALPKLSVGITPLVNKAALLARQPTPETIQLAIELLEKACDIDAKSELAKITLAQLKLQAGKTEEAIKLFEEAADLSRSLEEKVQATSFAEASKIQVRIHSDPVLGLKIKEMLEAYGAQNLQG